MVISSGLEYYRCTLTSGGAIKIEVCHDTDSDGRRGVLFTVTPALAAPPEIEDVCFAQIENGRAPPLGSAGRGEREAFMANCIAVLTGTPPPKRSRYKKPR